LNLSSCHLDYLSKFIFHHQSYNQLTFQRRKIREKYEGGSFIGSNKPPPRVLTAYEKVKELPLKNNLSIEQLNLLYETCSTLRPEIDASTAKHEADIQTLQDSISRIKAKIDENEKALMALTKKQHWYLTQKGTAENLERTMIELEEMDQL
jgi:hypothetical protein